MATYNHKDDTSALDLSNFKITHTNLGVINREMKEHWLESSTKQIIWQSQKDGVLKKRLKAKFHTMVEYIRSLKGQSLATNSSSWPIFDPSVPKNQKLMDDLIEGKAIISIIHDWIDCVIILVTKFI